MFSRKLITFILYVIVLILIFIMQPAMFFDKDGNIKSFDYNIDNENTFTILRCIHKGDNQFKINQK